MNGKMQAGLAITALVLLAILVAAQIGHIIF